MTRSDAPRGKTSEYI